MTPRHASPLALALLLPACGDDGGRDSDRPSATAVTITTAPTSPSSPSGVSVSAGDTDSDSAAPTEGGGDSLTGTDSASASVPPGTDTDTSPSTDTGDPTGDPGGPSSDPTSLTETGFPGELTCSEDLHSVVDTFGQLVEECPSSEACYMGACVPACDAIAQVEGTVGCDFWAPTPPFLSNAQGSSLDGPCFAVFLANAWNGPANITVTRGGQQYDVNQFGRIPKANGNNVTYEPIPPGGLPPDEVAILFLSHKPGSNNFGNALTCPSAPAIAQDTAVQATGVGQAFFVHSDVPVSAYDINPYGGALSFLPSASLLFPSTSWGQNHMAIAPKPNDSAMFAMVVAREDNTTIKVAPAQAFPGGGGQPPRPPA